MPRKFVLLHEECNSVFAVAEDEDWFPPDLDMSEERSRLPEPEMGEKMHATMGYSEHDREAYTTSVLAEYHESLSMKSEMQLGYSAISRSDYYDDLAPFFRFHINNIGDPFISGNYATHSRKFEVAVLDWFAKLWEIEDDEYWGYITNGGREGNLHGLFLGREIFPSGILYTSRESHYSIFKAARMFKMECEVIQSLASGEIDLADLNAKLLFNKDKAAIINVNIGTLRFHLHGYQLT